MDQRIQSFALCQRESNARASRFVDAPGHVHGLRARGRRRHSSVLFILVPLGSLQFSPRHDRTCATAWSTGRCRALHLLSATTRTATAEPAALELCVRHDGGGQDRGTAAATAQARWGSRSDTEGRQRTWPRVERILPLLKLIAARSLVGAPDVGKVAITNGLTQHSA
jgi:GTPase involved in cell partitioning and DNA repair